MDVVPVLNQGDDKGACLLPELRMTVRAERKEAKQLPAGDKIDSTQEMEVTLLLLQVPGCCCCCCSEKEGRLALRCTGQAAQNPGITGGFQVSTILLA